MLAGLLVFGVAFAVGFAQTSGTGRPSQHLQVESAPSDTSAAISVPSSASVSTGSEVPVVTTVPCRLALGSGTAASVPVDQVCSAAGAPHFESPQAAMVYLASAWNSGDVQKIDYVTDPNGRRQMDAMAAQMADLRFESCTQNPNGDYTCYFSHAIAPSTSPTTYPNPAGYPPGEAVFTVAPATGPGWYLTYVVHCG